jgi:hypothetical protein
VSSGEVHVYSLFPCDFPFSSFPIHSKSPPLAPSLIVTFFPFCLFFPGSFPSSSFHIIPFHPPITLPSASSRPIYPISISTSRLSLPYTSSPITSRVIIIGQKSGRTDGLHLRQVSLPLFWLLDYPPFVLADPGMLRQHPVVLDRSVYIIWCRKSGEVSYD